MLNVDSPKVDHRKRLQCQFLAFIRGNPRARQRDIFASTPGNNALKTLALKDLVECGLVRESKVEGSASREYSAGVHDRFCGVGPVFAGVQADASPKQAKNTLAVLLAATRNGATIELESLCDKLDMSPAKVRALVDEARASGYQLDIAGSMIGRRPSDVPDDECLVQMPQSVDSRQVFAIASDLHIGSKHFMREALEDFVSKAYARGARTILCPGDMLDGVYKFSVWEQRERGFEEQASAAVAELPQRPGMTWHMILGNHDETFERDSGMSVGHALVDTFKRFGRNDLVCHGARGAYLRLKNESERRGLIVELWHPKGTPGYAVDYKLRRHIEGYSVSQKPDVLAVGHFHQHGYFCTRGVHGLACGTFQGGKSNFGKSLGGAPAIGGWIVDYALTADGTVREFSPTWVAYYENESPREIGLN